jgi:hypothetical protein
MSAPNTPSPAPRADEDRANLLSRTSESTKPAAPRNFTSVYLAKRCRLPMPVATLVARPKGEVRHER